MEKFARNKKLSTEEQFQKNINDFNNLIKTHVSHYELECITAEKSMSKIKDTIECYEKAQHILIEEEKGE